MKLKILATRPTLLVLTLWLVARRRGSPCSTFRAKSGGDQPKSRLQQGFAAFRLSHEQRHCNSLIRNGFWNQTARFHTKSTITPTTSAPGAVASADIHRQVGCCSA